MMSRSYSCPRHSEASQVPGLIGSGGWSLEFGGAARPEGHGCAGSKRRGAGGGAHRQAPFLVAFEERAQVFQTMVAAEKGAGAGMFYDRGALATIRRSQLVSDGFHVLGKLVRPRKALGSAHAQLLLTNRLGPLHT